MAGTDVTRRPPIRSRWLTLAALLGLLVTLGAAQLAYAHSGLVSVIPADGATLTAPPTAIELVFNEDVNPQFSAVVVTRDGNGVQMDTPVVAGPKLTSAVKESLTPGNYRIAYRVVSKDGHPISGDTTFVLAGPTTSSPAAPTGGSTGTTTGPGSTTVSTAPATPIAPTPISGSQQSPTAALAVITVISLLVLAGGGALVWRSRRRDEDVL